MNGVLGSASDGAWLPTDPRAAPAAPHAALGYLPDLAYNIAVCHYRLQQYGPALKYIVEIQDRGVKEHPGTRRAAPTIAAHPTCASPPWLTGARAARQSWALARARTGRTFAAWATAKR